MVFLSVALPARASRRTNIVVASLFVLVSAANPLGEPWVYYYVLVCLCGDCSPRSRHPVCMDVASGRIAGGSDHEAEPVST
jgi:hypothetical protein